MPEKKTKFKVFEQSWRSCDEGIVENIIELFKDSTKVLHVSIDIFIDQVRSVRR